MPKRKRSKTSKRDHSTHTNVNTSSKKRRKYTKKKKRKKRVSKTNSKSECNDPKKAGHSKDEESDEEGTEQQMQTVVAVDSGIATNNSNQKHSNVSGIRDQASAGKSNVEEVTLEQKQRELSEENSLRYSVPPMSNNSIDRSQNGTHAKQRTGANQSGVYLFDDSCLYCMLEIFLIAYNLNNNKNNDDDNHSAESECEKYGLWEWLWMFERSASSHFRILMTPIQNLNLFEVRIDSIHGHPSGLCQQLIAANMTFEYYYAYSRGHLWGGWIFIQNGTQITHKMYGIRHHNRKANRSAANNKKKSKDTETESAEMEAEFAIQMPTILWKNLVWFRQIEMERMYKTFGGSNMKIPHHKSKKNRRQTSPSTKKKDIHTYNMQQIFDDKWMLSHYCNNNNINGNCVTLHFSDILLMLGTKHEMVCAQCLQSHRLCRAMKICDAFKGYFTIADLNDRHKAMALDVY